MASAPLRRRVVAELTRRARLEIADTAQPLDYVESWIIHGGSVTRLARSLQNTLAENVSRPFVHFCIARLSPDARARIAAAREARGTSKVATYPHPSALAPRWRRAPQTAARYSVADAATLGIAATHTSARWPASDQCEERHGGRSSDADRVKPDHDFGGAA